MRVIAGSAGGVRLAVPKRGVRPTMDRVKAAIFSSLGETVINAQVLDLFADAPFILKNFARRIFLFGQPLQNDVDGVQQVKEGNLRLGRHGVGLELRLAR